MQLQERIELLVKLGTYMQSDNEEWAQIKHKASVENAWFAPEFIHIAVENIVNNFLQKDKLTSWAAIYQLPAENASPKTVGIVMAGNIPLVGFHDFLCVFITGHYMVIKPSSKDDVLLKHLVKKLYEWEIVVQNYISFSEILKNCDAYIATGSNNSGRYFEYYFNKYPNIIRKNRTSVAILDGTETTAELTRLAADIQQYFGLGCRNITQLYVPEGYDFIPLLDVLKEYEWLVENHKYKHNLDYHLALLIMNSKYYMSNGSIVLAENVSPFSPVSQVHYAFYTDVKAVETALQNNEEIQCVVGHGHTGFGAAQSPLLTDYADGVDTISFLKEL